MQNPLRSNIRVFRSFPFFPAASRALKFSEEIDAQRRRKGSGPEGRADAPVYRPEGGGTGGGGFQPSSGGGRSGGLRLPPWMIIVIFILLLIFGGKGFLGQLLGGTTDTGYPTDQAPVANIATQAPGGQSAPVAGFTPPAGSRAEVGPSCFTRTPMMNRKKLFRYVESEDLQILELPYAGDSLSMLVLLPRENEGLAKLEDSLVNEKLDEWIRNLAETEVQVSLPSFELTFPFRLDDMLKSMGMVDAFSDKADFSAMDASRTLFIGAVLHKAFVAVNEQGTEAAAATAVVMQLKTVAFPSIVFRADHPFVFLIREKETGSLLFIGRVVNPV